MSDLPPIRPRQVVGTAPGGTVIMDPTFARWLEQLARGVNALNNGTTASVSTPLPVASYAAPAEAAPMHALYPVQDDQPPLVAAYEPQREDSLPTAFYPHDHEPPLPIADYT